jgi:hypothetical protein
VSTNTDNCLRLLTSDSCRLRAPLRHFCLVLAQLANWKTGRGIAGQGRLARAMGVDTRTIKRLKAELQEADSPVTVTWAHRSRPDGLNGSDAYLIAPAAEVDRGHPVRDRGQLYGGQVTSGHTNITSGSPQGNTTVIESKNSFSGDRPQASPELMGERARRHLLPSTWRPNATHVGSAAKLGVELAGAAAGFLGYWQGRAGSERTMQEWDATFGGWLKRQAPAPEPTAAELEAAATKAWLKGGA